MNPSFPNPGYICFATIRIFLPTQLAALSPKVGASACVCWPESRSFMGSTLLPFREQSIVRYTLSLNDSLSILGWLSISITSPTFAVFVDTQFPFVWSRNSFILILFITLVC